jgi:hypothetical protein
MAAGSSRGLLKLESEADFNHAFAEDDTLSQDEDDEVFVYRERDDDEKDDLGIEYLERDDNDELELQIALDQMTTGNLEPLKYHLAKIQGMDPELFSIRSSPWNAADSEPGSKVAFIAKMDVLGEPESKFPTSRVKPPRVELLCPEKPHEYSSLEHNRKQIRLLRLGPKDDNGIIRNLELQPFDLTESPKFYALSYVWGCPDKKMPLPCNGERLNITQNLFRALDKTFERYPDVWLWADGICINQEDVVERGHQVGMMGQIYSRAALVVAHLGHHHYDMEDFDGSLEFQRRSKIETSEVKPTVNLIDALPTSNNVDENLLRLSGETLDEEPSKGPASSQPAVSLMNYMSRKWASDDKDWKKQNLPDDAKAFGIWARLLEIWKEDWFYRSWIVQEAVLGKEVVLLIDDAACSLDFAMQFWDRAKKRAPPEILKRSPLADDYARILHLSPIGAINALRDLKHPKPPSISLSGGNDGISTTSEEADYEDLGKTETKSDLLSLLCLFRTNLASDPRDKLYSLLGLVKGNSLADSIAPDYSEANTTAILYRTLATKFIESGKGTEILQHAGNDNRTPDLPSWVPDWSYQSRSNVQVDLYNCSGSSRASISVSESDPNVLRVRGTIIDNIRMTGMAWRYYSTDEEQEKFAPFEKAPELTHPPFTDEDSRCLIRDVAKGLVDTNRAKLKVSEDAYLAMARTLVMDRTWRGERTGADDSFPDSYNGFERLYAAAPKDDTPETTKVHKSGIFDWVWDFDEDEESTLRSQSWPFEVAVQESHKGRRFCITANGYMCTAPYNSERGDVVVIFEGFRMPFVLRKSGNDWKLVGDCYVHGIMDGELVVPVKDIEASPDQTSVDANEESFAVRTSSGFAKFVEFRLI